MQKRQDDTNIAKFLLKYKNVNATIKKDIVDTLNTYRGLDYKLDSYVFNDGTTKDLFNMCGTIPITYKGSTYHIPISIYLMDTHPINAPLCYVKPTPDMQIKISKYVDGNGKVYLPYLHDWNSNTSDLLGLLQVMVIIFGDFPPVYARPKEASNMPYPPMNYMPSGNDSGNKFMPYPPAGGGAGGNNLPYPVQSNFPPYPTGGPMAMPSAASPYPLWGPTNTAPYPNFNSVYDTTNPSGTGTITEEHIKASLISAVEDKIRRRIRERVNGYQAEIQTLNRTKQELVEGRAKIDDIISKFEREENEIKTNIAVLKDKKESLEKSLESLEKVGGIDVDEAVTTTAPLYRQLLNAYAEEAATEDSIYYIGEALRSSVIDLETFLKLVRQLSRKQFMFRAIMQKCRQKAGLAA